MRRFAGGVLVICLLAPGCGGDGSSVGGVSRGAQCDQLLQAFCSRASRDCALFPSDQVPECVQSGRTSCCAGNCSATAVSTQQDIDTCIGDIGLASCGTLDTAHGGTLPQTCQRVATSTLADHVFPE